jgi:hypothetical protein
VQAVAGVAVGPTIDVEVIARALIYMGSIAPDANVLFLTLMTTRVPFLVQP